MCSQRTYLQTFSEFGPGDMRVNPVGFRGFMRIQELYETYTDPIPVTDPIKKSVRSVRIGNPVRFESGCRQNNLFALFLPVVFRRPGDFRITLGDKGATFLEPVSDADTNRVVHRPEQGDGKTIKMRPRGLIKPC